MKMGFHTAQNNSSEDQFPRERTNMSSYTPLYPSLTEMQNVKATNPVSAEEKKQLNEQIKLVQKQLKLFLQNMSVVPEPWQQDIEEKLKLMQQDVMPLKMRDQLQQQQKEDLKKDLSEIKIFISDLLIQITGKMLPPIQQKKLDKFIKKMEQLQKNKVEEEASNFCSLYTIIAIAFLFIASAAYLRTPASTTTTMGEDILQNLEEIRKDFPSQSSRTWASLRAGAKDFTDLKIQRPLIILLTGQSKDTRCLGEKFIQAFQRAAFFLDAEKVSGNDYGETIDMLREKIEQTGALLLHGLQNLDGGHAEALHVICDRESPLVRDVVVVLTADTSLDNISDNWRGHVSEDKLPALLTRIGSRVVTVSAENNLPCAV